jgi:hypothetical protein
VKRPHEVWRNSGHTVYLRKYADPGVRGMSRWMAVFVPKSSVRTYYSTIKINQADDRFRRGTLIRKR